MLHPLFRGNFAASEIHLLMTAYSAMLNLIPALTVQPRTPYLCIYVADCLFFFRISFVKQHSEHTSDLFGSSNYHMKGHGDFCMFVFPSSPFPLLCPIANRKRLGCGQSFRSVYLFFFIKVLNCMRLFRDSTRDRGRFRLCDFSIAYIR